MSQETESEAAELIKTAEACEKQKDWQGQLQAIEALCQLFPDDPDHACDKAIAQIRTGDPKAAAETMIACVLTEKGCGGKYKALLVTALSASAVTEYSDDAKRAVRSCFDSMYDCELQPLFASWMNLVLTSTQTGTFKDPLFAVEQSVFDTWMEDQLASNDESPLSDPFFIEGLSTFIIAHPSMEIFLTRLRRYFCLNLNRLQESGKTGKFRKMLFALARQCFINEFVFLQQEDELEKTEWILSDRDNLTEFSLVLLACYQPLAGILSKEAVEEYSEKYGQDPDFSGLLRVIYEEPEEEKRLALTLESFGDIKNAISGSVQKQYESFPYPRWLSTPSGPRLLDDVVTDPDASQRILVAGCGTGQHAISAAARHPGAEVVAIDLSRASLSYAKRKASEAGLASRIRFVHADILSMKDWPEQFDVIESCGVLHHMEDPASGWNTLAERLKPGGYFKVALYSRTARIPVSNARKYVKENDLGDDVASIRNMRYAIFAQPAGNAVREFFVNSTDFYTTSRVRDAIFNVQEHLFDLPEIDELIRQSGLDFVRFTLSRAGVSIRYKELFPEDAAQTNLNNWAVMEQKYPGMFAGMYQFWVKKPSDSSIL